MKMGFIHPLGDNKLTLLMLASGLLAACQPQSRSRALVAPPAVGSPHGGGHTTEGDQGQASSRESDSVVVGVTTISALQQSLGEPTQVERDQYFYSNCTYQIQQERVQMASCQPSGPEVTLQYWRQLWKNVPLDYSPLEGRLYRLSASQLHLAVIYDTESDRVIQVVRHVR